MNDLVPSIGSSTQTILGIGSLRAVFLAEDAVIWEGSADQRAHRGLRGAVGRGDRIEIGAAALVLDAERGSEERQDGVAGRGRKLVDKSGKINGSHAPDVCADLFRLSCAANRRHP